MPKNEPQAVIEKPWRLDACPECGYALQGLPDQGNCPECGKPFDRTRVILVGWDRTLYGRRGFFAMFLVAFGHIILLAPGRSGPAIKPPDTVERLFGACMAMAGTTQLATRWITRRPALSVVNMDENCCSQIDDLAVRDGNIWAKLRRQSPFLFIFGASLYIFGDISFSP